jgi:hypothetical protein
MSTSTSLAQSPNRGLGIVVGIIFLLVGLFGFFVATPYPFATTQGTVLIGLFGLNALLSTIHVIVGAVLLLSGLLGARISKTVNVIFGLGLFVLGVFGLFFDHTGLNIFALNAASNLLHFAAAVVLLIVGISSDKILTRPVAA